MDNESTEMLTLIKIGCFEQVSYYIFMNEQGEFRSLESNKCDVPIEPGMSVTAKIKKKGCAGREITELHFN